MIYQTFQLNMFKGRAIYVQYKLATIGEMEQSDYFHINQHPHKFYSELESDRT